LLLYVGERKPASRIGGWWWMERLAIHCCDSHLHLTRMQRGSNDVGFSMGTRLLRLKGMNGLRILSSTGLLVQTTLPTRHQPSCRLHRCCDTQLGSSPTTPTTSLPEWRFGVKMVHIYTAGKPIYTGDSGRFRVLSSGVGLPSRRCCGLKHGAANN
jgi:hypothetical protein